MTLLDVARDLRIAADEAMADCPAKALHFAEKAVRELRERVAPKARPRFRVVGRLVRNAAEGE